MYEYYKNIDLDKPFWKVHCIDLFQTASVLTLEELKAYD